MANRPPAPAESPLLDETARVRAEARETVARAKAACERNARQLEMTRKAIDASRQLLVSFRDPFRYLGPTSKR